MALITRKYLDYDGLVTLLRKFQDYPTNDILGAVINAIDSSKADKTDVVSDVSYDVNNSKFTQTINGTTSDIVTVETLLTSFIHQDTASNWNEKRNYIGERNHIYIYTDYDDDEDTPIASIKIGDGSAYLIDTPFLNGNETKLNAHIADTIVHITSNERTAWNNKVTCFMDSTNQEMIVFSKDNNINI